MLKDRVRPDSRWKGRDTTRGAVLAPFGWSAEIVAVI
jgi:hypothetical protein